MRRNNSRSNISNGSRRKTNEKKFRQETEGIKHLDFMHTLDMKAKSRGRNRYENFHKNSNQPVYSNKKMLKAGKEPKRWERLYNLAAEKEVKIKRLQKEVHGYTFEGDPRIKESCKRSGKLSKRSVSVSKRSRSKSVISNPKSKYSKNSRMSYDNLSKRTDCSRERNT